jgi:hypothetical protein
MSVGTDSTLSQRGPRRDVRQDGGPSRPAPPTDPIPDSQRGRLPTSLAVAIAALAGAGLVAWFFADGVLPARAGGSFFVVLSLVVGVNAIAAALVALDPHLAAGDRRSDVGLRIRVATA